MNYDTNEIIRRLMPELYRDLLGDLAPQERAALEKQIEHRFATLLQGEAGQGFAFSDVIGFGADGVKPWGDLPVQRIEADFDAAVSVPQINAVADLYFIYQHERMKIFEVIDVLRRLFKLGGLRVQRGTGARGLYVLEKWSPLRYSKQDRMIAYKRAFNYGQGDVASGAVVNENFHYQFVALMSALAQYQRDLTISEVVKGGKSLEDRPYGNIATIQRLGTDLRYSLDRSSYGNIFALAYEVGQYLRTALELLEAPDILKGFDANNKWDVVEQVSQRHLGGHAPLSQRAKMAETGRRILEYLGATSFDTGADIDVFRTDIKPMAANAEAWIAAYRMTAEGRRFPGVGKQMRWSVGLSRRPGKAPVHA